MPETTDDKLKEALARKAITLVESRTPLDFQFNLAKLLEVARALAVHRR